MNHLVYHLLSICFALFLFTISCMRGTHPWDHHGQLVVSANGHYIQHQDGTPFAWIGDTGWAMFQRLTREQVDLYLDNRQEKGFTVIQSVLFWYPHGGDMPLGPHNEANVYGFRPFTGNEDSPNTSEPLVVKGGSIENPNDYWDHADYIIKAARSRDLYLALLPCWGNAYINNRMKGTKIEFTGDEARAYGTFLGDRYKNEPHIIWTLGGDVDPKNFGDQDQRHVYRAMAEGIGRGVSGNNTLRWNEVHPDWNATFMTFHAVQVPHYADGGKGGSSSAWFHADAWLDVNMMETFKWTESIYPFVRKDYLKTEPTKPTIMGEGAYEDGKYGNHCGWVTPLKVRRQAYHTFFAGAAGHTFGHWAVWPFRGENCGKTWDTALDTPGAKDVASVLKQFLIEQDWQTLIPDQSLLLSDPGSGETRQCAMLKRDRSKILVYFPDIQSAMVDYDRLNRLSDIKLRWMDPRTGEELISDSISPTITPPADWQDAVAIFE